VVYTSPDTTITLATADATNPRIDLFAVDTLGHAIKITGVAASTPLTPQVDPNSQLALTTGITLNANDTVPTTPAPTSTLIYDENVEWTTGGTATVNYNNTTNPYHGTKDASVSYTKNQTLTFTGTTQTVNGQVLRAFIRLNNSNYNFQFQFFNGTTAVTNPFVLNGFGFNPALFNTYQNASIPLSAFTWSGTNFDKLVITMSGKGQTGTYYIDYVSLESGTTNIPPATDYSYKVDSVKNRNDSLFWYANGIPHYSGFNAYQRSQTDSITAQLRSEIVSAAGGGVISFNGRNGSVTSDSTDYNSFFYTKHITDSLLASKISAANLSLGTVTSTSQAINNSAGTGVVLPSASISTAGLMTAGDKVLVNTISGKVNYTDTAAMLSPYLRKADAFTKSQADALYKPITYVPTWSEITGKPAIPAAQIQSDYTQTDTTKLDYIKHKPTIPTNNNQLTNGMGYITSIDTANTLHTYDSTLYTTIYKNSLKLNIADSSSMLAHYLNSVGFGLSKTGQVVSVDTSVIHSSAYNNATYQGKITLTTTGTSGAATLSGSTLNIPQYSVGGGTTTNAVTFNNSGTGDASGTTFNGSVARTVSSNTIGAVAKADSITAYVTPTQLAAINNHINLYYPLYGINADSSVHLKNDSLPLLTYAPGVDTSGTNAMDLPVKKWVLDRLSSTGVGLNDSVYVSMTGTDNSLTLHRLNGDSSKVVFDFSPTSGTVTNVTATDPLSVTGASTLTPNVVADTSKSIGRLATFSDVALKQNQLSGTGYVKFSGATPSYFTPTQVTADLNLFTTSLQGLVPPSGGGTTNFLRADGTWAAAAGGSGWGLTGNAGTTAGTNFMGTTDNVDVVLKRFNTEGLRISGNTFSAGIGAAAVPQNTVSIGYYAGSGFTDAIGGGVFIGTTAGQNATTAEHSVFIGTQSGKGATNSYYSNFIGYLAGNGTTAAQQSNFFGPYAGQGATNASFSNILGVHAGDGATGASYSNFLGFHVGQSSTHVITGTNNILIGTNITTPAAASANTFNIGNVLYGFNTYGNTSGNPSKIAQTNGRVGINNESPDTSAVLDLTSVKKGFLPPRMTTTQRLGIVTGVANGTRVAGSGYTNGTYTNIALTGGTGTGATATITVLSNQVAFVTISDGGSGYVISDVLSASGFGAGSGFTYTVTALTYGAEGLTVYDTTLHKLFTWDGTTWQAAW
jgi:hypothetical protein